MDISYYKSVESTNDIAGQMAKEGAPQGSVVVADQQTAGRGRFNRSWLSGRGKGLWFSLVLRPEAEAERLSQLTIVMAVAIAEAMEALYGLSLGIKWPNDLLLDGKKICGILSEGRIEDGKVAHVIIGIGLNIGPPEGAEAAEVGGIAEAGVVDAVLRSESSTGGVRLDPDQTAPGGVDKAADTPVAAYLEMVPGLKVDKDRLLKELLENIMKWYESWLEKGFEPIRAAWLERSVTIGQVVEVRDFRQMISGETPEVFLGRAIDIDQAGSLVVEGIDGEIRSFNSGEVSLRRDENEKRS